MKRQIFLALFLVAFVLEPSLAAQTRKQSRNKSAPRNPQNEAALNPMPDPRAEALTVVNGEIQKVCSDLEKTINEANQSYSKPPFDTLTPAADFQTTCKADGTVAWTAARTGGAGGDPSNTQSTILVKLKVSDLNLGHLTSQHGVVTFGTNDSHIHVTGPSTIGGAAAVNVDTDVEQWWIDLRDEGKLTTKFKKSIQTLIEKLSEKSKLMD
jgi:hypothetical protein